MDELWKAQKLIETGKLFNLKAIIDLENVEKALKLTVPGINDSKETIFNLSQSSEIIICILCSEIPFVISDLLNVLTVPVFYKGCLIIEVNGKLSFLFQNMHSLQIDLRSLTLNMRLRRRVEFERLFWLKTRKSMFEKERHSLYWSPAKTVFRQHLRKIIDRKLCSHLVFKNMENVKGRLETITHLATSRNKTTLNSLSLPSDCFPRRNLAGTKHRYYSSMFIDTSTPSGLLLRRAQRKKDPALLMEENWIEITCNSQIENLKEDYPMEIDENKNEQNNENLEAKFLTSIIFKETKNQRRCSFSIRIFLDEMGLFYWGCPILKAKEIQELQMATFQGEFQSPKVVLLGVLEDCQDYLLKLFSSITEKGPTSFEITKSLNNTINMEEVLPEKFRYFINDSIFLTESEFISVRQRDELNKKHYNIILNKKLDLLNFSY